jgi:hypothetical protein
MGSARDCCRQGVGPCPPASFGVRDA